MLVSDEQAEGQKSFLLHKRADVSASPSPVRRKKRKETLAVSINEMLDRVRRIWFELDDGGGRLELECDVVAFKLCTPQF